MSQAPVTGVLMAIFMSNSGGAWDNAKKYIAEGNHGGNGSDSHKASVVGYPVDPSSEVLLCFVFVLWFSMGISFRCKPFSIILLTYFLIFLFYLFFFIS